MKAILLVGGEGTRLRPLTFSVPKSMVPIINRPYLEHLIKYLRRYDVDDIILTLCYLPNAIKRYFGDGSSYGVKLTYIVEDTPLGTAGAVKNIASKIDSTCFVLNGDVFTDIDLSDMLRLHQVKKAKATIALTPVEDPTAYGVVETAKEGNVLRFIEKPRREEVTSNWINAGIYIIQPEILNLIPKGTHYMFERGVFPSLLEKQEAIFGFKSEAYWIDIGTPAKYSMLHRDLLQGKVKRDMPGHLRDESIWLENNIKIGRGVCIDGPVSIANNCRLGDASKIKGPSVIASNCVIGRESVISDSIIWENTRIGEGATLKGCLIAEGVIIGNHAEISDMCILGHDVVIGDFEKLAPGTVIWPVCNSKK